jgi:hypothetical protein
MCAPGANCGTQRSASANGKNGESRAKDDDDWKNIAGSNREKRGDHRNDRADAVEDSVSIGCLFANGEHDRADSERQTDEEDVTPGVEEPAGRRDASDSGRGNPEWNLH